MPIRHLIADDLGVDEDWEGNNASFTCPVCKKVFIVSGHLHRGERKCPFCNKSIAHIKGGRMNNGSAWIEW